MSLDAKLSWTAKKQKVKSVRQLMRGMKLL